jgi:hypothetical protein
MKDIDGARGKDVLVVDGTWLAAADVDADIADEVDWGDFDDRIVSFSSLFFSEGSTTGTSNSFRLAMISPYETYAPLFLEFSSGLDNSETTPRYMIL